MMWKRIQQGFLAFLKRLGELQAWLILTGFYFIVLAPVALIFKLVADPLRLHRSLRSIWHTRPQSADRWRWMRSQA